MSSRENALVFATTSTLITARRYGSGISAKEFGQLSTVTLADLVADLDEPRAKLMRMAILIGQLANAAAYLLDQLALHDPARADQFVHKLAEFGVGGVSCR